MAKLKNISRAEVLSGLGGRATKQAHTLLALIENRTAHLVAHAHQVANPALAAAVPLRAPRAFLAAIAQGRAELPPPTIQEIERYADDWAMLVPDNPTIRATLAHLFGQKYAVPAQTAPGLRAALGVESDAVQQAYQRLYQQPISTIFAPQVNWWEQMRWRWAAFSGRLEKLPPFWLTFFLTLPAVSGLLALPIALASVGPFWGVIIIVSLGVINMVTVAALAETVVRSGVARFGLGFLGQLAQEYLGPAATTVLTIALVVSNFLVLIIFFLGVGGTLASATGLPAALWMLLLFGVTLYFLSRRSLNATVTTNLLIVFANLLIVLAILLLALPAFQGRNLLDSGNTPAFTPAALGSIVGILSATFLSHYLTATYGPVILPRDPGGRAWVRGNVAAVGAMTVIAVLWLLINVGVLSPTTLREAKGTVVTPLAAVVGPTVNLLGSLLVILSLGLATIQVSLAQYYSLEERLPAPGTATWVGKLSSAQRFGLSVSPMVLVLGLAIWLLSSGVGSFAGLLGTVNVLALPWLTGIIPLLLLVATRRMGDFVPEFAWRWLGHPLLVGLLVLFFVATILLHGLYIWQPLPLRLLGLLGGLVLGVISLRVWRQSQSTSRVVISLQRDERRHGVSQVQVVGNGQPLPVALAIHYRERTEQAQAASAFLTNPAELRNVTIGLPALAASQLKVWLQHLTPEGTATGWPAQVVVTNGQTQQKFVVSPEQTAVTQPWPAAGQVEIRLTDQG